MSDDSIRYHMGTSNDEIINKIFGHNCEILDVDENIIQSFPLSITLPFIIYNGRNERIPGNSKGKVTIPDDFNEPLDDLKNYM